MIKEIINILDFMNKFIEKKTTFQIFYETLQVCLHFYTEDTLPKWLIS